MNNFTHLNLHTEYSIVDGIIRIKQLINYYKILNINTVCVTDTCTVSSFPELYQICLNNNMKLILGIELFIIIEEKVLPIILIIKNYNGYLNLMSLISSCWRYGNLELSIILNSQWIINYLKNLIIIINLRYFLLEKIKLNNLFLLIKKINKLYGEDFYLEICKLNFPFENYINKKILEISNYFNLKLVATNSVKFLFKKEFASSLCKIFICQNKKFDDNLFFDYSCNQYIKTFYEMSLIFKNIKDAIKNIDDIVEKTNLKFNFYRFNLPSINVNFNNIKKKVFKNLIKKGLKNRILKKKKNIKNYIGRINKELLIILNLSLLDYFLIILEFMFFSRKKKIAAGPGRGSGASSLICYTLYISDIDPIKENLLFERFFSTERIGIPDLDLDFCALERNNFVKYIFYYYHYKCISQIITYSTLSVKSSVRDISRAIGLDYISGERFSKSIPSSLELSMEDIFRISLKARRYISSSKKNFDIWKSSSYLEGIYKGISKHAGGIVITKGDLDNFTPILFDENECLTHFEKIFLQDLGLIKFDFLGLKTLSIINFTLKMLNKIHTGIFSLDDESTIQLINNTDTELIFQLESYGMKKLIRILPIENFYDIINLLSLYRPGPIYSGFINDFINRKNNLVKTYHPYLDCDYKKSKYILAYTHGIIIFQEQVISLILSYIKCNMYDAEKIYNAMINKNNNYLIKSKIIFTKKCKYLGINFNNSSKFFDLIERFASYSFNKTHAHSYAKLVYQTAYLKSNHLLEFCLSNVFVEQMLGNDLDKVLLNIIISGVSIYTPNINISSDNFKIYKYGIMYGFSIVDYIDDFFIDKILYYRNKIFYYNNFEIFCKIFSFFKIKKKKVIENLIFCGFFDCFRINRFLLFVNFQFIYEKIVSLSKEYNRTIIYKFIKYIDYSFLKSIKKKILKVNLNNILLIEKKMLKIFASILPSDIFFLKILGYNNLNNLDRIEKIELNFLIIMLKKRDFFDKNKFLIKVYNNNIVEFFYKSFGSRLPNFDTELLLVIRKNKKKKNVVCKSYFSKIIIKLTSIIFLYIQYNFFYIYYIIKFIFNKFKFNGSKIFFKIKLKNIVLDSKICINLDNYFFNILNYLNIKKYKVIFFYK